MEHLQGPNLVDNVIDGPGIPQQYVREANSISKYHETFDRPNLHLLDLMPEEPLQSPMGAILLVGVVLNRYLFARSGYVWKTPFLAKCSAGGLWWWDTPWIPGID
jgi:hypothetical protein